MKYMGSRRLDTAPSFAEPAICKADHNRSLESLIEASNFLQFLDAAARDPF